MSGHNRWSKIKHKKAATDAKKSKGWTKVIKELTISAKMGGGDIDGNPRLRSAVDKARAENIPNETIARAIKKGSGDLESVAYEDLIYEVYGPGGTAIVVEILTDNRNRTASEARSLIDRHGGKLGASGSVLYNFKKRGGIVFEIGTVDEDKLMEAALELGAEDLKNEGETLTVLTEPGAYMDIKDALLKQGFKPVGGEVALIPENTVAVSDNDARKLLKLIDLLEEHDDVQNVYANFDIPDDVLQAVLA